MKRIITLFAALAAFFVSGNAMAAEPDSPGTKLITIQAGYGPGIGALVSGNIAMANLAGGHLYGGLQLGGNFRHGAATGTHKMDLSLAPRVMLGWNLGRVVELHAGHAYLGILFHFLLKRDGLAVSGSEGLVALVDVPGAGGKAESSHKVSPFVS